MTHLPISSHGEVSSQFGVFLFGAHQFDAFHFGAFPNFVSMLIQYSMQFFFFSAKASSICAHVSFLRMFSAKKCCLRQVAAKPLY